MKTLFYPRLAWDGIRKNKRMVFPYILTCICMICMFYILAFLASPTVIDLLPKGRDTAGMVMTLGYIVIAIFSTIFLYYTNSFLIRRRTSEFGLYNVLGMNKWNLIRIITLESLITAAISIVVGLFFGIALSKLAELGFVKVIGGTVTFDLHVNGICVRNTVVCYLVIFAIIWLSSVIRIRKSSAVSLLKSENTGEKAPKANWFLGVLGVVILAAAYYIAVSIENPIMAILWFFVAVIMVIIATYLLMISGSVLFCRLLQKNKKYYYAPKHFVSVSSMVYRMKRNGAGLASIAIIATMVLVMTSAASCLWFGTQDILNKRYPAEINLSIRFYKDGYLETEKLEKMRSIIESFREKTGSETKLIIDMPCIQTYALEAENGLLITPYDDSTFFNRGRSISFISIDDYNRETGQDAVLNDGEALVFSKGFSLKSDDVVLNTETRSLKLKPANHGEKKYFTYNGAEDLFPQMTLVVSDLSVVEKLLENREKDYSISRIWAYSFDLAQSPLSEEEYAKSLRKSIEEAAPDSFDDGTDYLIIWEIRENEASEYIALNGSLFFIGCVLSVVFIFAAVLIIYYKQISEGYEDCKRFEVMRKVGMTKKDIKSSINSQLLAVFFIPLIFAGLHLCFAFPMIDKVLMLFGLLNKGLFLLTTSITFAMFAVFYTIVYKATSNVYYNIVTAAK